MNGEVGTEIQRVASNLSVGQHKVRCPVCSHTRSRHKSDKSLSLKVDGKGVQYQCHHCDIVLAIISCLESCHLFTQIP